ncbi:hypothetical protein ACLESD_28380 [Pyxidicoccus sp. 3LFB2]
MSDPGAQYLVLYALDPWGQLERELKELMGPAFMPGALPCEAGPFTPAEAAEALTRLEAAEGDLGAFDGLMRFQPSLETIPSLSCDEAEHLARTAAEEELRREAGGEARAPVTWSWVGAFELPRCWAFLLHWGPNIPPGLGVVVDKHSRIVLVWRYVDVRPALQSAGFDVTPATGRSIRTKGPSRPPSKALLTKDLELVEHALYRQPDGTKMCLEVWAGPDGRAQIEVDSARHRFRRASEAPSQTSPWEPYED